MQATRKRTQGTGGAGAAGGLGGSLGDAIIRAAKKYKVPVWVLVGVKLMETGSSATAANPFQFEPGTAAQAGVRNVNDPYESAEGAAKLLHGYKRKFGSWNAAFEAYNGGPGAVGRGVAYTQADVEAKLHEFGLGQLAPGGAHNVLSLKELPLLESLNPFNWFKKHPSETPPGKEVERVGGAINSIGGLVEVLTDVHTWLRIGELLAGAVLIYLALKTLTGTGVSDLPGAGLAAKVVP
jgi:hypothetical protein